MDKNSNKLSFISLIKEANESLNRGEKPKFIDDSLLSGEDLSSVLEFIFSKDLDSVDGESITIGDISYDVINASIEQGSLFMWLWSDSLDEEKIMRIDLSAGFVDSDPTTDDDDFDEED